MMTDTEVSAFMLRCRVVRREMVRDSYARAVNWQAKTYTEAWGDRGCRTSATRQLNKAARHVDALLTQEF